MGFWRVRYLRRQITTAKTNPMAGRRPPGLALHQNAAPTALPLHAYFPEVTSALLVAKSFGQVREIE